MCLYKMTASFHANILGPIEPIVKARTTMTIVVNNVIVTIVIGAKATTNGGSNTKMMHSFTKCKWQKSIY